MFKRCLLTSWSCMSRKVGNIIIILLLLIATGGIPVTRHYCGSNAISFSLYSKPKPCCKGPCDKCHNIFKFSKINDEFETGSSSTVLPLKEYVTLQSIYFPDLSNNYPLASFPDIINWQTNFNLRAGTSPASIGNFRC